jgi:hypothetical protein
LDGNTCLVGAEENALIGRILHSWQGRTCSRYGWSSSGRATRGSATG